MSFNSKNVCSIVEITQRQLGYWDKIHFIKPSVQEASGYGSLRLYSFIDLVQLKVAKKLREQGISLQKIRKSINYLKKNFPEIKSPMAQVKFLTDGVSIFVLTKNKKVVIDTLNQGQLVMTISLDKIIDAINNEVKKFNKPKKYTVNVKKRKYNVILHPDLEDGGFWVDCPSLEGCASQGDTVEEALEMIKDAINGHLILEKELSRKEKKAA